MRDAAISLEAMPRREPRARPRASRSANARKAGRPAAGAWRHLFRQVPRYGAIASSALIGVGIIVNALMMQHGHHPAPLFGSTDRAGPAETAAKPLAKLVTKPAAGAGAVGEAAAATPAPLPSPTVAAAPGPARSATRPATERTARSDDPIARLLAGPPAAAHRAKPAADKPGPSRTVPARVAEGKIAAAKARRSE